MVKKRIWAQIWAQDGVCVVAGKLPRGPGRPPNIQPLFKYVAEKLPFDCLDKVMGEMSNADNIEGVYLAHDSVRVKK
jgi:hypothetical protein